MTGISRRRSQAVKRGIRPVRVEYVDTRRQGELVWCLRNTFAQVGEPFAELARRDDESYREYFEEELRRRRREWPWNAVNLFLRHHTSIRIISTSDPQFSRGSQQGSFEKSGSEKG